MLLLYAGVLYLDDGEGHIYMLGECRTLGCFWRFKGARSTTIASVLRVETGGEHMPASFLHSKFIASGGSWHARVYNSV